ncbi:NDR1/HIN1-like protein [Rufibacter roseus]|uniref:LEA type 2 family protein n=1 Tax=Rufibacter roseus TaxID=1567108 RepID=A0ABW2DME8_9BACT|nr:LEA type 2 family protein [Rufibacter roseus]
MNKKAKWTLLAIALLALLAGLAYYIVTKKYYPKVKDVAYLHLDLTSDTAQVQAGLEVQNRIPLAISIDSIRYSLKGENMLLGWGQMTSSYTLPPVGEEVLDFKMLLKHEAYRQHLQTQKGKDSIKIAVKAEIYFDLPFISAQSITLNRNITVPVPKAPAMKLQDVQVRQFSVDSGYSLLFKVDATNQNLPKLRISDFQYHLRIGDSLVIEGQVDSTFRLQKGDDVLEVPLQLKTSDAVALVQKVLSDDKKWNYHARLKAVVQSDHRLLDKFDMAVEKTGVFPVGGFGNQKNYMPVLRQVKKVEVVSGEEQTQLQADVVVHNPSPFPFYIDSVSYFIRHQGKLIASGKKDFEVVLPKNGNQRLNPRLVIDEKAYQQLMSRVQGQQTATLELELNLLYNLPNAARQKIILNRQVQVPVQKQASIKVAGLTVQELSPEEGAKLLLRLQVQGGDVPNLNIKNLDYTLQLSEGIEITGKTQEPIKLSSGDSEVEVPLHLSAEDVNQLVQRALKGSTDWSYDLQATANLTSSHDFIQNTKIELDFQGELELGKTSGTGGKKWVPHITKIDTLQLVIQYDTAWVKLHLQVKNPLPVSFKIDSLLLTLSHDNGTIAVAREEVGKVLPAEGQQAAWVTLGVNYSLWQEYLKEHQEEDSLSIQETVTLVYSLESLAQQRTSFQNAFKVPTPGQPVTALQKVKLKGFSFTKGILVDGQVEVKNLNVKQLEVKNPTYSACVENLLDVCGTINRTYQVAQGESIVNVPMNFGIGEMFRAIVAKFTSKGKSRTVYIKANATVNTSNPILQNTWVKLEMWRKEVLFPKKKK